MILATIIIFFLVFGAIAYWVRQGWVAAEKARKAFEPRVQTPTSEESTRLRYQQTGFDPYDDRHLSMLLKKQAD